MKSHICEWAIGLMLFTGLLAGQATATEIPFSGINMIDGDFDGAVCVYVVNLDGDWDRDIIVVARKLATKDHAHHSHK